MQTASGNHIRITFFESLTVLSFVAVGYALLYKFSFYYNLGVPWYLTTISPLSLFISSLLFFITSCIGIGLGFFVYRIVIFFDNKYQNIIPLIIASIILVTLVVISLPILSYWQTSIIKDYIDIILINQIFLVSTPTFLLLIHLNLHFKRNEDLKISKIYKILLITLFLFVLSAYLFGSLEAKSVLEKRNLSEVILTIDTKGNSEKVLEKWFLVDLIGEKALIMKNNQQKIFRLIEYKEISEIKVGPSRLDKIDEKFELK